jgi:hypothetical protein
VTVRIWAAFVPAVLLLVLGACAQLIGIDDLPAPVPPDAGDDGALDAEVDALPDAKSDRGENDAKTDAGESDAQGEEKATATDGRSDGGEA